MNKKMTHSQMLARLRPDSVLLPPLVVRSCVVQVGTGTREDACLEVALPGETETFQFIVQSKSRSTPQSIEGAVAQAKTAVRDGQWPMIQVPYLSPVRLDELESQRVSGVDLCGNGIVIVPGRLWVVRSGRPNLYRDSRPLHNPYRGRSAMVARMLLHQPRWESLKGLAAAIRAAGDELSLPQVSKAIHALGEELIISKTAGVITLREPLRLLDGLAGEWALARTQFRQALRLPAGMNWAEALSSEKLLRWAVTGESSVSRYVMFSQGGPPRIAVSNLTRAMDVLHGTPEPVPGFADLELLETDEPGCFFATEADEDGVRWASPLQAWLELQAGDARQQDAARELRARILGRVQP